MKSGELTFPLERTTRLLLAGNSKLQHVTAEMRLVLLEIFGQ